jgi:hypothetical protein
MTNKIIPDTNITAAMNPDTIVIECTIHAVRDGNKIRGITYGKERQVMDCHALAVNRYMQPMCGVSGVTTA